MEDAPKQSPPLEMKAPIEGTPKTTLFKPLRSMLGNKARALAAAGLVGVAGAGFTSEAEAQNLNMVTPVYVNPTNTRPVVLRVNDGKTALKVLGVAAVLSMLRGPLMKEPSQVDPRAVEVLQSFGYIIRPGLILNVNDPASNINIGPRTTRVNIKHQEINTKEGPKDFVFIEVESLEQGTNRKVRDIVTLGEDPTGKVTPQVSRVF